VPGRAARLSVGLWRDALVGLLVADRRRQASVSDKSAGTSTCRQLRLADQRAYTAEATCATSDAVIRTAFTDGQECLAAPTEIGVGRALQAVARLAVRQGVGTRRWVLTGQSHVAEAFSFDDASAVARLGTLTVGRQGADLTNIRAAHVAMSGCAGLCGAFEVAYAGLAGRLASAKHQDAVLFGLRLGSFALSANGIRVVLYTKQRRVRIPIDSQSLGLGDLGTDFGRDSYAASGCVEGEPLKTAAFADSAADASGEFLDELCRRCRSLQADVFVERP